VWTGYARDTRPATDIGAFRGWVILTQSAFYGSSLKSTVPPAAARAFCGDLRVEP